MIKEKNTPKQCVDFVVVTQYPVLSNATMDMVIEYYVQKTFHSMSLIAANGFDRSPKKQTQRYIAKCQDFFDEVLHRPISEAEFMEFVRITRAIAHNQREPKKRKTDPFMKASLWIQQNGLSAISKEKILLEESQVDHTIAQKFVGNDLTNNLQLVTAQENIDKGVSVVGHCK